ncbi:hypothetical protein [Parabacteroides goldsteinii]|jgi:hypothetical protein|uniref:hypothetical protein n=1 Tax=Parabacteroides goldsteinii TaxID=328812 RepID=UPI001D3C65E1|nr:hypothetical protein [Parabacteroides goldsteinii]MBS6576945.1 hypothetical protein [Parabacteroides goldsteinii]
MAARKYDYIIIYSILFASILSIAVLVRLLVISELQMDEFSGLVAFVIVCLLLGAAYLSFQSIIDVWLLPVIERTVRKKYPQIECEPEVEPIGSMPNGEISVPNYDEYKQTAQQKIQQEQAKVLENVLTYTVQELALYLTESELQQLCEHIRFFQYATENEYKQIKIPVAVDATLKSIDLMHFGWNIGNQFKKTGIETATFVKRVFAERLKESEISTIKRKLRAEGTCIIKIKEKL